MIRSLKENVNNFLMRDQFNALKWSKFRDNYKTVQNIFLNTFLNKNEISEYQKTYSYKLAIAMGYVDFVGPSIKIGTGELTYNHQMPDFKLAISYSINGLTDENYKSLVDFSSRLFKIYTELYYTNHHHSSSNWYFEWQFVSYHNIWDLSYHKQFSDLKNSEINNLLTTFSRKYYTEKSERLNWLGISDKYLKEKNVYFSIKNVDDNLKNDVEFNFISQEGKDNFSLDPFFLLKNVSDKKPFKNFDYMILNLFGVIKIKFKFNREEINTYNKIAIL